MDFNMVAKEDLIYSRKEFLNLPGYHSMANIVCNIYKDRWKEDNKEKVATNALFQLADCSRAINLSLTFDDIDDRENNLNKIDVLISVLQEMRTVLEREELYIEETPLA